MQKTYPPKCRKWCSRRCQETYPLCGASARAHVRCAVWRFYWPTHWLTDSFHLPSLGFFFNLRSDQHCTVTKSPHTVSSVTRAVPLVEKKGGVRGEYVWWEQSNRSEEVFKVLFIRSRTRKNALSLSPPPSSREPFCGSAPGTCNFLLAQPRQKSELEYWLEV